MSWLYKIVAVGSLVLYASAGFLGWEFGSSAKKEIPASVRQSPGGYRSFHFWHMGIRGGK